MRSWSLDGEPPGTGPAITVTLAEPDLRSEALVVRDAAGQEGEQAFAKALVTDTM